jgi:hypothetical protein
LATCITGPDLTPFLSAYLQGSYLAKITICIISVMIRKGVWEPKEKSVIQDYALFNHGAEGGICLKAKQSLAFRQIAVNLIYHFRLFQAIRSHTPAPNKTMGGPIILLIL